MPHEKEIAGVVEKLLSPLLDALVDRNAKRASRTAGHLTFWRDGMLGDLERIASGKHDRKTIASLKQKFEESAPRVERVMKELQKLRHILAPSKIADQIDIILHHNQFGKGSIREGIQMLLWDFEYDSNRDDVAAFAAEVCRNVRVLNAELQKLGRMVRG